MTYAGDLNCIELIEHVHVRDIKSTYSNAIYNIKFCIIFEFALINYYCSKIC